MRRPKIHFADGRRAHCASTIVVAEIGQNHNGRVELAEQLVDAAAWAGADAVKTVKRDLPSELTTAAFQRRYDSPHAFAPTYGEHRAALELSIDVHASLCRRAHKHGLSFIVTVCDVPSARQIAELPIDALKIASRDLNNLPLLDCVAKLGRPIILSTGMSDFAEIDAAVEVVRRGGAEFALLQCTSAYPTLDADVHLNSLATLASRYAAPVGFSDHTLGIAIAPAAVALGAAIIEKHFTLDRALKGTDHACSAEPEELRQLVENVRRVESALGKADKPVPPQVAAARTKLGRSLVARSALSAGTQIDESMLTLKSPGDGVPWTRRELVVGRRLRRAVAADELVRADDVE